MDKRIKQLEKEIRELKKAKFNTQHLETSVQILKQEYRDRLSAWDRVQIARAKDRPSSLDFLNALFSDFFELHGDRYFGDDKAVVAGIAKLNDLPVTVVAITKGKTTDENIERNFGMVHPEGYRKALRLMKQAEKFKRPIVTLIDTPGAYPGIGAEERGQAEAIAQNLMQMMELKVPVIAIILGEAGSGGALALAVADRVWMMENAIYSILSPEGFASILYKDSSRAPEAAEVMKITAKDLLGLGVIDEMIEESSGFDEIFAYLKERLTRELQLLMKLNVRVMLKQRYLRYRKMGEVTRDQ